ncbi:MAG: gamma-glutamyl-gamma-aminobutyrate hydrolase family protein, partial [Pyramidobacter sp.]|nr:gamma-glutamyl-gamma-aminobutyrate hydrolase family protein [Pyramidobacter sp.]
MTDRPKIAVACNLDTAQGGAVPIVGLLETYTDAVLEGGAVPFVLPATTDETLLNAYLDMADGVLMPGGIDIDPLIYNEGPDLNIGRLNPLLDHYQIALIRLARARSMPIFGICRGVQVMNVAFGGTLVQHLANDKRTF